MLTFAVCDDEPYMLETLAVWVSDYLQSAGIPFQCLRFPNGKSLLAQGQPLDLLFLDIQMEPPDGLETARILRAQGYNGLLVFITVLREAVFDSFGVGAFDYLLKPLEEGRFSHTMHRICAAYTMQGATSITVRKGGAYRIIPFQELIYCEVLGRKIYLHTRGGEVIDYYDKLSALAQALGRRFFRCHRSYLVNLDDVRGLRDGRVLLPDGDNIPVSRLREQALTEALLAHLKERQR